MSIEIPASVVREIRDRLDLADWIGQSVALKKYGHQWKGLCPFHSEKTPSFTVSPGKQLFYCFGCQVGGDIITFQRMLTNQPYPEVVRELADRAGVSIPEKPLSPEERKRREERQRDVSILALAQELFLDLFRKAPRKAYEAARNRGYTDDLLEKEGLGYSGEGWEDVVSLLQRKKVPLDRAEALGLVVGRKGGGFYDRFRDRLTFPITDAQGDLIGFGGRALGEDPAKYLNSPESPLYHKGSTLFRLRLAKDAVRRTGTVILCEGYFDAIAFVAAGHANAVACCGTAFTPEQARILKRYARRVITAFDGDRAGQKATSAAVPILAAEGLQHDVMEFPEKDDPDSYRQRLGADGLSEAVSKARPVMDVLLDHLQAYGEQGVRQKSSAIARMTEYLQMVPSEVERELYFQKTAAAFRVPLDLLRKEGKRPVSPSVGSARPRPTVRTKAPAKNMTREEVFVGLLLNQPALLSRVTKVWIEECISTQTLKDLALRLVQEYEQDPDVRTDRLAYGESQMTGSETADAFPVVAALTIRASEYAEPETAQKALEDCILGLERDRASRVRERLLQEVKEAEESGNHEKARVLLQELQALLAKQRG